MGHSPKVKKSVAIVDKFEPCVVYGPATAGFPSALCTYRPTSPEPSVVLPTVAAT